MRLEGMRTLHATKSGAAHIQLATGGRATVDAAPRAGVETATLYAAYRLPLVRLAVLLVDELTLAEDVVQDAFVGLHRLSGRLDDPGAALAYLRVSVVNGARSALRRRGTVRRFLARASAPDEMAPADHEVLLAEARDATLEAVRRLPARQREVLVLRYWGDLTERQIAQAMGITEGTVKSTASRALDALERMLEEQRL